MSHDLPSPPQPAYEQPTRRQKLRMSLVCGLVGLAVYALSALPMAWLNRQVRFPQFQEGLELFYAPLILAARIYFAVFRGG